MKDTKKTKVGRLKKKYGDTTKLITEGSKGTVSSQTEMPSEEAKPQKADWREILRRILRAICLLVFIGSLCLLGKYLWTYYSSNKDYNDLWDSLKGTSGATQGTEESSTEAESEEVEAPTIVIGTNGSASEIIMPSTAEPTEPPEPTRSPEELDIFPPNWTADEIIDRDDHNMLAAINPDYACWINIPNTPINYPVVQGEDNSHYLRYDFKNQEIVTGCPFIDYAQNKDMSSRVTTICGHNMKDERMFGTLKNYKDKSFWEESPYIYIVTPERAYRYEIFAVYEQYYVSFVFSSHFDDKQFASLLSHAAENALYDTGVEVSTDDHVLTLYTCTDDEDYRLIVHAVCTNYE